MNRICSTPLFSFSSCFTICNRPLNTLVLSLRKAGACSFNGLPNSQESWLKETSQTVGLIISNSQWCFYNGYIIRNNGPKEYHLTSYHSPCQRTSREWSPNCCEFVKSGAALYYDLANGYNLFEWSKSWSSRLHRELTQLKIACQVHFEEQEIHLV
jgi:hypothetical protein